jgi:hypothetical protein
MRAFHCLVAFACALALFASPPSHARSMPDQLAIHLVLIGEDMQPVPNMALEASFVQSTPTFGFFLFDGKKDTKVKFSCTTDAAGKCPLTVPLSFGVAFKTKHFRMIEGSIDRVGMPGVAALPLEVSKGLRFSDAKDGMIGLHIFVRDGKARLGRFDRMASVDTIAAALTKSKESTQDEMVLTSYAAYPLLHVAPQYVTTNRGYMSTSTDTKTGITSYRIVATVTIHTAMGRLEAIDSALGKILGGHAPVDPAAASYQMDGKTITLTGRRLSRESSTMYDEDDATTVELLLDLPHEQLKAILANYVEGSDDVFTFTTDKNHGSIKVEMPLVEMAATVKRVDQLKQVQPGTGVPSN